MKKYLNMILALFIFLMAFVPIYAIVDDNGSYCNDHARVLSLDSVSDINARGWELENMSGAQVVVVTVKTTSGLSTQDYAVQLFNSWGLGDRNKNNGVLILVVTEQKDYWILQGDGIKNIITDSYLADLIYDQKFDDMVDYANDYSYRINMVHRLICNKLTYYYESKTIPPIEPTFPVKIMLNMIWGWLVILLAYRIYLNKKAKEKLEGTEIILEQRTVPKPRPIKVRPQKRLYDETLPPKKQPMPPIVEEPRFKPKTTIRQTTSTHTTSHASRPVSRPSRPSQTPSSTKVQRGKGGGHSSGGGVGRH